MQIVIDIQKEIKDFVSGKKIVSDDTACDYLYELRKAVNNGIVLPKGHGRLIDADEIISEATERMKYPANHKYMECVIAHMQLANQIIPADKTESEDE